MAETPLSNTPNVNSILASINALYAALRSTLAPRTAAGIVEPGAADLGSTTNPWQRLYVEELVAGGQIVDLAAAAVSASIFVFDASDATFSWPGSQSKCLAIAFSGVGGGDGLGTGAAPTDGGATTITRGGVTVSSRPGLAGSTTLSEIAFWGNYAESNTAGGSRRRFGSQRSQARIFTGVAQADMFNIQIGSGGTGRVHNDPTRGGQDGDDGFALLFAF